MPELPEVQTVTSDLNKKVKGLEILDVWTDWQKLLKRSKGGFEGFKKSVKGEKIKNVRRIGKNIVFDLSDDKIMLIHLKMTGHVLVGDWKLNKGKWIPTKEGILNEKVNGYIHVVFTLSGNKLMALSDMRKFAKVLVANKNDFEELEDIKNIGPDPLLPSFTVSKFIEIMRKKRGPIKKVLMDQDVVSGIGNIYASDILFLARVHPLAKTENLNNDELKKIFSSIRKILEKAVKLRGTSVSDYRDTAGKKGGYGDVRLVYGREGEKCPRLRQGFGGQANKCDGTIKRIKIGARSAHFCPACQRL
jgi:formamidopyrimidine-DNA glycosylase